MDEKPTKRQFDLQKILLFMAAIFLILASALIIIKGYDLNKHLINVGLNQNKRAELIITKLKGRKIREAYYREKRYLVGQSMLPDKHLYLIDPYGDRKTALLVSVSRAMVIFHFSRGGAKVICHPRGQGYLPV
jgi:hypothetical protein